MAIDMLNREPILCQASGGLTFYVPLPSSISLELVAVGELIAKPHRNLKKRTLQCVGFFLIQLLTLLLVHSFPQNHPAFYQEGDNTTETR